MMRWSLLFGALVGLASAGCAGGSTDKPTTTETPLVETDTPHPAVSEETRQLYAVGEVAYEDGRFGDAVALFRQALLALPQTAAADDLRHALILRIAHTQLLAWNATGNGAYLTDAQVMLERYAIVHEQIAGNGERAQAERGEVYELLYEVESALEPEVEPEPESETESDPEASSQPESKPANAHAGETLTPEMVRKVRVRDSRLASLDDPRVKARLISRFSDPVAGLVLTKGVDGLLHGPRPLVRILGAKAEDDADVEDRKLARRGALAAIRGARVELRDCYRRAYARNRIDAVDAKLTVVVEPDGTVARAELINGLDTIGTACVQTRVEEQRVEEPPSKTVDVVVALAFFYEGAKRIEGTRSFRTGVEPPFPPDQRMEMPDIDEFAKPDPSPMFR